MRRPEFVTNEDIDRWSESIDNDPDLPKSIASNPIIREACFAGQWLGEELMKLKCPEDKVVRIVYTAGQLSFGRDTWQVSQDLLEKYKQNTLEYEPDISQMN